MAKVEEEVAAAAEEVDDWQGGWQLCSVIYFGPIVFLTVTTSAAEGQGNCAVSSREAHPGSSSSCCCQCAIVSVGVGDVIDAVTVAVIVSTTITNAAAIFSCAAHFG